MTNDKYRLAAMISCISILVMGRHHVILIYRPISNRYEMLMLTIAIEKISLAN